MPLYARWREIRLWLRLARVLAAFLWLGPSISYVSTVDACPAWLGRVTLLGLLGFRRREGNSWPYRPRVARLIHTLNQWLPAWVAYRGVLQPLCALNLARMTGRNVTRYGAELERHTGLSPAAQFADVLTTCLRYPGTLPSEYYVFGMHRDPPRAPELANGYEVEILVTLLRPSAHPTHGSAFAAEELEWLNDKQRFRELCNKADVRTLPALATFAGGEAEWRAANTLPPQDLFLKPLRGGGGTVRRVSSTTRARISTEWMFPSRC